MFYLNYYHGHYTSLLIVSGAYAPVPGLQLHQDAYVPVSGPDPSPDLISHPPLTTLTCISPWHFTLSVPKADPSSSHSLSQTDGSNVCDLCHALFSCINQTSWVLASILPSLTGIITWYSWALFHACPLQTNVLSKWQ